MELKKLITEYILMKRQIHLLTPGSVILLVIQSGFFDWSALKMTKYEEKFKYLNWSANCSSQKVLSVKPQ